MIKTSEKIENIAAALVAFQSECPVVAFDAKNPFLKNRYASMTAIVQATKPALAKAELSVLQMVTAEGLVTRILHKSGEWIESTAPMLEVTEEKGKSTAQVYGSIITYLRRYTYSAALGIVSDEDGDGQGVNGKVSTKPKQTKSEKDILRDHVKRLFANYKGDNREDIRDILNEKVKAGEDSIDFYNNIIKDLENYEDTQNAAK